MQDNNDQFAARIKELRTKLGMTQEEMADIVGVRKTSISNYESGYATPTLATLKRFMENFNLPASYFLPDLTMEVTTKKAQIIYGTPMPYFEPANIAGLTTGERMLMDSSLTLPARMHIPKKGYISTIATDNSMNLCGIKKGSCVIINTEKKQPADGDIFAAVRNNELIIRRYRNNIEGTYMEAESTRIPTGLSIEPIPQERFEILGTIDSVITKL